MFISYISVPLGVLNRVVSSHDVTRCPYKTNRQAINSPLWTSQVRPGEAGVLPARCPRTFMMLLQTWAHKLNWNISQTFHLFYIPFAIFLCILCLEMLLCPSLGSYCHCLKPASLPSLFTLRHSVECWDFFSLFSLSFSARAVRLNCQLNLSCR